MKKLMALLAIVAMISATACSKNKDSSSKESSIPPATTSASESVTDAESSETEPAISAKYQEYASMTPEEVVSKLTLEQKAAQMVQPAVYYLVDDSSDMKTYGYGSVLSKIPGWGQSDWKVITNDLQEQALNSDAGIPMIYGNDDVHGVNFCTNAVYFPHNIGLGAADDEELMYQVGLITADEARICHMPWNFAPVVTQSVDPRWGRTYECYGSDLDDITRLSTSYTKGLVDGGVVACAKHFFGEGAAEYGTGEDSVNGDEFVDRLIDRGNATLSDDEINKLLSVYKAQIDAGVQTIMVSHASLNGTKMHENKKYIMMLKEDMGFEGFIVSDWNSIQNIPDKTYKEQVITAINSGIDMLMEADSYNEAMEIIVEAVNNGDISEERINDAVRRIIKVKMENGLFDDPMFENVQTTQTSVGSQEYRDIAEKLVEESLVLLKNDGNVLPLKEGSSVYITGPAADNGQAQCGGWTIDWTETPDIDVPGVTTILDGFTEKAEEYGLNVITDESKASEADVVVVVVGEQSYAEWTGDTPDMELCGELGLKGNAEAIAEAEALGKPTVACVVAGRQVILGDCYDKCDGVVMCYLPGSEGQGVADVLCGGSSFTGKLPSPWYNSVDQIGTGDCWLERGFGLTY